VSPGDGGRAIGNPAVTPMSHEDAPLLELVIDAYSESSGFNGVLGSHLAELLDVDWEGVKPKIEDLIRSELVEIVHEDWFPNTHIKPFDPPPVSEQIRKLGDSTPTSLCVYPTTKALAAKRKPRRYSGRPYSSRLWRGEPQFRPVFFDLAVLDRYRTDPRYRFGFDDNGGFIGVKDAYFVSSEFRARDKILLQTFGIGYDARGGRVVAVFLWYLSELTPEHQRTWEAHERDDPCAINPDYFRSAMGEFPTHGSIYTALLLEQIAINQMCEAMGRPLLLHRTYSGDRPPGFHVFFQPTLRYFHAFVLELDKLLSQNLDCRFFTGEVSQTRSIQRKDGVVVQQQRGSLDQLEEWLRTSFITDDRTAVDRVIEPMREVRRERQAPAHAIVEDRFDIAYWDRQDELVKRAYLAMRTLRLILTNYPGAQNVVIPEWISEGRIRLH
jgi:hypothetical protein